MFSGDFSKMRGLFRIYQLYNKCTNVVLGELMSVRKQKGINTYVAGMQEGEKIWGASIVR